VTAARGLPVTMPVRRGRLLDVLDAAQCRALLAVTMPVHRVRLLDRTGRGSAGLMRLTITMPVRRVRGRKHRSRGGTRFARAYSRSCPWAGGGG